MTRYEIGEEYPDIEEKIYKPKLRTKGVRKEFKPQSSKDREKIPPVTTSRLSSYLRTLPPELQIYGSRLLKDDVPQRVLSIQKQAHKRENPEYIWKNFRKENGQNGAPLLLPNTMALVFEHLAQYWFGEEHSDPTNFPIGAGATREIFRRIDQNPDNYSRPNGLLIDTVSPIPTVNDFILSVVSPNNPSRIAQLERVAQLSETLRGQSFSLGTEPVILHEAGQTRLRDILFKNPKVILITPNQTQVDNSFPNVNHLRSPFPKPMIEKVTTTLLDDIYLH